eukprot:g640.t1
MSTCLADVLSDRTLYNPCYCEENVYNLVNWLTRHGEAIIDNLRVVFISNKNKSVPIWKQRASQEENGFIIWDYHVILIDQGASVVWDLDSTLDQFPTPLITYIEQALQPNLNLSPSLQRSYRVVPASVYLSNFASDRRHMKSGDDWIKTPPSYPCIINSRNDIHTLHKYLIMDSSSTKDDEEYLYGRIMFQTEFLLKMHFPLTHM